MGKKPRSDRFQIKFNSESVHPHNIRIKDLTQVLQAFEEGLLALVKKNSASILESELGVSLVNIKEGCAAFELKSTDEASKAIIKPAMQEMCKAVNSKNRESYPKEVRTSIHNFEELSYKYDCKFELRLHSSNKRPNAVIIPFKKKTHLLEDTPLAGETTIYGKVESVGGANTPVVWLRQSDGSRVSIDISHEQAPMFGERIYSWLGLRGYAQWENKDGSLQSFKLIEILDYEDKPLTKAFDQLTKNIGVFFEDIGNVNSFVEDLRRG